MSDITLQTHSAQQTWHLGCCLGSAACPNDVIALTGYLGSGKTQLVKGIAQGLKVQDLRMVNSPTFVIINEYDGRLHMFHVDAYRLGQAEELTQLGLETMLNSDGLMVIEWAEKVQPLLPADHLGIHIRYCGETDRQFELESHGSASTALLNRVRRSYDPS